MSNFPILKDGFRGELVCGFPLNFTDFMGSDYGSWVVMFPDVWGRVWHFPVICKLTDLWAD